jgi:senataxin
MGNFPQTVRTKFFEAVHVRQASWIKEEYQLAVADTSVDPTASELPGLSGLRVSTGQLILGTPALLDSPDVAAVLDATIDAAPTAINASVTSHGLTPGLVHLLTASSPVRRRWSRIQLAGLVRHPLSLDEWCNLGIGVQVQAMYTGPADIEAQDKWGIIAEIVTKGSLKADVVSRGVLEGVNTLKYDARPGKSLMAVLAPLLGVPSEGESVLTVQRSELIK